jgi:hypothetical protein
MKKSISFILFLTLAFTIPFSACKKGLDYKPKYGLNSETVYNSADNYVNVMAKIYGSFVLTGNKGPAGEPDITGFDEGASGYLRVLWNLQELTTDEAICGWGDPGIPELNNMSWSSDNQWVKYMYYRIYFTIPMCNEFIRESSDAKMDERGFNEAEKSKIRAFRAEARFIRALAYYHQVDFFGAGPFVTDEDEPGAFNPEYATRSKIYDYVESELLAIENDITNARQNEYGRADKAAVWTLLAKLYLNSEVYVNRARYTEAATYCDKVINAGYTLDTQYKNIFRANNNLSPEIIFPITADGNNTQTYGCTTFLVHASLGGSMVDTQFGVTGKWAGLRAKPNLVNLFVDTLVSDSASSHVDTRYSFYKKGQSRGINTVSTFTHGYAMAKYKNIKRAPEVGNDTVIKGSDKTGNFVDIDYPLFRLADVYLMYAEAVLRGGAGSLSTAIGYVNQLRQRAYKNTTGNVTAIDLNFILDERARELQWEGYRRTDLIRYGKFTSGTYVWPFKGGVQAGTGVANFYNIFPIPNSDIIANPNLTQNPGY